ncbi:hypothetical protein P7C70_g4975, partial [Phenoliferia sp. Uapishka_3]
MLSPLPAALLLSLLFSLSDSVAGTAFSLSSTPLAAPPQHPFLSNLSWNATVSIAERIATFLPENPTFREIEAQADSKRIDERDWQIPTDGLPPYPVYDWISGNDSTWPILANAGVRRMQTCYLDDAIRTFNWWRSWAYDNSTGKVWDTLAAGTCEKEYEQTFTYNSAIIIGALVDLYKGTGSGLYLSTAQSIAYAAIRDFTNAAGVMEEGCEHYGPPNNEGDVSAADGGPTNNLPEGCQSDTIMFKAILAQNLGYLYRAAPDDTLYKYIVFNFLMNAFLNLDESFLFGEWWSGPLNTTLANQLTQGNALGILSAGVVVNLQYTDALRNASGLGVVKVPDKFQVPLPDAARRKERNVLKL